MFQQKMMVQGDYTNGLEWSSPRRGQIQDFFQLCFLEWLNACNINIQAA